jgi:hypothetical protein
MTEATIMLFDLIAQPDFVYVTFPEYAVDAFAGVGSRFDGQVRHRYLEGKTA